MFVPTSTFGLWRLRDNVGNLRAGCYHKPRESSCRRRFSSIRWIMPRSSKTAGVPVAQAEAQAKALGAVLTNTVASPGDLVAVESNLATRIDSLESRLDA